ncbi:MAG: NAD(P)H-hydrate dehydratase [Anaerolineae bacterium]
MDTTKLVTAEEMRRFEQAADAAGLGYAAMMERAGQAVAQAVQQRVSKPRGRVLVLVGPGNNGGDGLVCARVLHLWGHAVTVYLWKRAQAEDPNLERVHALHIPTLRAEEDEDLHALRAALTGCDVVVDALLGTGATGALRGRLPDILRKVARQIGQSAETNGLLPIGWSRPAAARRPLVVAVDLPSGLDADTGRVDDATLSVDLTVTFAFPKRGHFILPGAARVGALAVADIGIEPALAREVPYAVATHAHVRSLLPRRPGDGHKGTFGKALVVGGSANYVGAPCLAAEAAYRVGAGLVTLAVPERIHRVAAGRILEATHLVLPDEMGALTPEALRILAPQVESYNAMLVGSGLGREAETEEFLAALVQGKSHRTRPVGFVATEAQDEPRLKLPRLIVDADGLNLLACRPAWWRLLPADTVLSPHPGEMATLLGTDIAGVQRDRLHVAHEAAQRWACTVVLKGAYTVVAAPSGEVTVIPFANPALGTAGTGDVLAGVIAGLLAQGLGGTAAAICGTYLHALAGELWRSRNGDAGMLAGELLPLLPQAIQAVKA